MTEYCVLDDVIIMTSKDVTVRVVVLRVITSCSLAVGDGKHFTVTLTTYCFRTYGQCESKVVPIYHLQQGGVKA